MIDVPVIQLRRWFEDLLHTKPPSYDVLLSQGSAALQSVQAADLRFELGPIVLLAGTNEKHYASVNDTRIELSPNQYAYLRFFAERRLPKKQEFEKVQKVDTELGAWLSKICTHEPRFQNMSEAFRKSDEDRLGKRLFDLRAFLKAHSDAGRRLAAFLPGKGRWALRLPPDAITLL